MVSTLKRNVYFFELKLSLKGKPVDAIKVFNHINNLPFADNDVNGRYLPIADGNQRSLIVESLNTPMKAIIGTRRLNGLPVEESGGVVSPLLLSPGHGLYEPTHFMIFSDNVMGMEYNQHGPRYGGLRTYILKKCKGIVDSVEINYLFRPDVLKMLSNVDGIRTIQLKVTNSDNRQIYPDGGEIIDDGESNDKESLWKGIHSFDKIEPDYVNVTLGSFSSKKGLNIGKREIINMISNPEIVDGVKKFKILPIDGAEFDLISPYLVYAAQVVKQDDVHNFVDSTSMFDEIERSYNKSIEIINESRKGLKE